MYSNKKLGQHFIKDSNIHKKIVKAAGNLRDYNVIEIGPGYGDLTKEILREEPKNFIAVEKDLSFSEHYAEHFQQHVNCFVFGDALSVDERNLIESPVKLVANLPFNISSQLLFKWLDYIAFFQSITIMLQKEFAQRITSLHDCSSYGRISVLTQLFCDTKYEFAVSPTCFIPPPKVDSAVISIYPLSAPRFDCSIKPLLDFTKFAFNYRRKQIKGIMRAYFSSKNLDSSDAIIMSILNNANIGPIARPGELSVKQYSQLSLVMAPYVDDN